jgi:hypothetical protein
MERCKTTLASFNGKIYHEHLKIIIYYLHAYDVNIIFLSYYACAGWLRTKKANFGTIIDVQRQ